MFFFAEDVLGVRQIWSWSDGSNSTDYLNWERNYPDDKFSDEPQCVRMDQNGNWRNQDCYDAVNSAHYICKADKSKDSLLEIQFTSNNFR